MARYSIHLFCDECAQTHSLGIMVNLEDGPVEKDSIGNTYEGKDVPESLRTCIHDNCTICPKTNRIISQVDTPNYYNCFLVPIKE